MWEFTEVLESGFTVLRVYGHILRRSSLHKERSLMTAV